MSRVLIFSAIAFAALLTCVSRAQAGPSRTAEAAYTYLHEHPELGGKETLAGTYLRARLEALGGVRFVNSERAPTAVIAVHETGRPGPVIALRAEMDARPLAQGLSEPDDHSPRSRIPGRMHNCGHDAHAAILLGAAEAIISGGTDVRGTVVFLFQPAEEVKGGAEDIVEEKLLETLGVEAIFALHAAPGVPVGTVTLSQGTPLAGSNYFTLTLSGQGSHAAVPFEGDDLPLVAARFVEALSALPARRVDVANRPFVLSVTKLVSEAGSLGALPETATIAGTIRAFEPVSGDGAGEPPLAALIGETVERLAAAHGVTAALDLRPGAPPTRNDAGLFAEIVPALQARWPGAFVIETRREMFAEDFAYYTAALPALYFGLGIARDGLGEAGVHTRQFTIHPDALGEGIRLMVTLAEAATLPAPSGLRRP